MDRYGTFAELIAHEREGVDFQVRVQRRVGASTVVVAPHGGGIEPGTSEVAARIAGRELSIFVLDGIKRTGNGSLHLTSTRFDEPRCLEIIASSDHVVAVHGERSEEAAVFLGGRDLALAAAVRAALEQGGYRVRTHHAPELQGLDPRNLCNRGSRGAGVQLELSAGLRRTLFASLDSEGRRFPTLELARLSFAVRQGLRAAGAL